MDKEELADLIGNVFGDLLEAHLARVHEDIGDLRSGLTDLKADVAEGLRIVREEMRGGLPSER